LPATQLSQTFEALAAAYVPAPQSAQVEATVAPIAAENLPAVQLVQTVEALTSEYVPALQSAQVEAFTAFLYFPAGHAAHPAPPESV